MRPPGSYQLTRRTTSHNDTRGITMNDRNNTLLALKALPLSNRPPVGFYSRQDYRAFPLDITASQPLIKWITRNPEKNTAGVMS